jgi:UrcA family protein
MKQSNTFNSITASLVFFVLGAPAIALANTSGKIEETRVTITYADLDLGKEAGVQALYLRLKRASEQACGVTSFLNAGSSFRMHQVKQCYRQALTEAVETIDNDLLTRIHAG